MRKAIAQKCPCGVGKFALGSAVAMTFGCINADEPDRNMIAQNSRDGVIRKGYGAGVAIVTIVYGDGNEWGFTSQMEW